MEVFRELRWASIGGNELQVARFDKVAALPDVEEGRLRQVYEDISRDDQDRGLNFGLVIALSEEFGKTLPSCLGPPRKKLKQGRSVVETREERGSESFGSAHEPAVQESTRLIST